MFFNAAPTEEAAVDKGDSSNRKQCIISFSPKMWKVWTIDCDFSRLNFYLQAAINRKSLILILFFPSSQELIDAFEIRSAMIHPTNTQTS